MENEGISREMKIECVLLFLMLHLQKNGEILYQLQYFGCATRLNYNIWSAKSQLNLFGKRGNKIEN